MKEEKNYKTQRPAGCGSPSHVSAVMVEMWNDTYYPLPKKTVKEQCQKCNCITMQTVQRTNCGLVHHCSNCQTMRVV